MSLAGWLAGIGGAAKGIDQTQMEEERRALDEKRLAVQQMIAQMNAGSRETVAGTNLEGKKYTADQTRQANTDRVVNTRITAANAEAGRNRRADQRNTTVTRGQDLTEGRFWGGDLPLRYDQLETGDATRRFGINTAAATAARGQDMASGDRENALEVARNNTRARNALGVLALKGKQKPNLFGTSAPATDWASEFDRLYNDGAGPDDVAETDAPSSPPPAAAAQPAAAAAPKPAPFAPPPAAAVKPPQGVQPGARVKLRNGQTVTITKVNPDGTIEYR